MERVVSPGLVGRQAELAQLAAAAAAPPAVAVVEGEPGIGKTRLVTELRTALPAGHRCLAGSCRAIREPVPLAPVLEAVRALGGAPPLAGSPPVARLSPVAGALRPLLPELAALLPPALEPLGDRAAERWRVFRALVAVCQAAGPVTVVLEDLHWADQHTVDFLRYVLADPPAGVSWVLTLRAEDAEPGVRALTARLPGPVTRSRIVLPPLDVPQTGALAAAIARVDRVPDRFATDLRRLTGGVPFAIEEVMALLRSRGAVAAAPDQPDRPDRPDHGWTLAAVTVPVAVRDHVLDRASLLPAAARPVLEAAAVLALPATEPVLAAVSGLPPDDVVTGLSRAIGAGLLAEDGAAAGAPDGAGAAIGFRHALAAQAVYGSLPGPRRRQLHGRAADALRAADPAPLGQVAHHLRQSGRTGEWLDAAEQAAGQAERLGHDDEAARLLEDLLRHLPDSAAGRRGRLAVQLGRAAVQALHFGDGVVGLLAEVLDTDLPRPVRGELRLRLAMLRERVGAEIGPQRQLFAAAVDDLAGHPDLQATAMVGLGIPSAPGVPIAECRRWLDRIQQVLPDLSDPALRLSIQAKVAMVLVAIGDRQWRALADQITAQTGDHPRQLAEITAYQSIGADACYAGHLAVADRLLAAGLAAATAQEARRHELLMRSTVGLLDYCRGQWDGLAERAEALAGQLADHAPGRADTEVVAGCLALTRGDLDRAGRQLADVTGRLAQQGVFDLLPVPVAAMLRLALGRGDVAGAVATARWYLDTTRSVPPVVSAVRALPPVTEALLAGGSGRQAERLVAGWRRRLRGLDAPLAPAAVRHAQGFLSAAGGAPAVAAAEFAAAAEAYESRHCPYEAAQAREQSGYAWQAAGEPDRAAEPLRAALAAYQRLGATWDLARAAHAARRHGVPVPAGHRGGRRGYGRELSPRERQVAELAASGSSNKEIAAQLFISPDTVKKQLQAVLRKLDIPSRAALPKVLPQRQP